MMLTYQKAYNTTCTNHTKNPYAGYKQVSKVLKFWFSYIHFVIRNHTEKIYNSDTYLALLLNI